MIGEKISQDLVEIHSTRLRSLRTGFSLIRLRAQAMAGQAVP
jgi:hypothetical protein